MSRFAPVLLFGLANGALPTFDFYFKLEDKKCEGKVMSKAGTLLFGTTYMATPAECEAACLTVHNCCGFELDNKAKLAESSDATGNCWVMVAPDGNCECDTSDELDYVSYRRNTPVDKTSDFPDFPLALTATHAPLPSLKCAGMSSVDPTASVQKCMEGCDATLGCCGVYAEADGQGAFTCQHRITDKNACDPCDAMGDGVGVAGATILRYYPRDRRPEIANYTSGIGVCNDNSFPLRLDWGADAEACRERCDVWNECCGFSVSFNTEDGSADGSHQCTGSSNCDCELSKEASYETYTPMFYRKNMQTNPSLNVWETLTMLRGSDSWFVKALEKAGFKPLLSDTNSEITVLMPDEGKLKEVHSQDESKFLDHIRLKSILDNHIVMRSVDYDVIPEGNEAKPVGELMTRNGEPLMLARDNVPLILAATNGAVAELNGGMWMNPQRMVFADYDTNLETTCTAGDDISVTVEFDSWPDQCAAECQHTEQCCGFMTKPEKFPDGSHRGPKCQLVLTQGTSCECTTEAAAEATFSYYKRTAGPVTDALELTAPTNYMIFGPGLTCMEGPGDRQDLGFQACVDRCNSQKAACVGFGYEDSKNLASGTCTLRSQNPCQVSMLDMNMKFEDRVRVWVHKLDLSASGPSSPSPGSPSPTPGSPSPPSSPSPSAPVKPVIAKVKGSMTLTVNDPETFVADAAAKTAVQKSIADAADVSQDSVEVTLECLGCSSRRLSAEARQLAASVGVSYVITLPEVATDALATVAASSVSTKLAASSVETLTTSISNNIGTDSGYTVKVESATVPTVEGIAGTPDSQASGALTHGTDRSPRRWVTPRFELGRRLWAAAGCRC